MPPSPLERSRADRRLIIRLTRRLIALGSSLTVTIGLLAAVVPAASAADSTTDLGLSLSYSTKSGDVAAGGGKIFVSAEDRIIITDSHGTLTDTITDLPYAADLAITPDGTRLYAALRGSNEVAEIDTAALTITRRISLAAHPCPSYLALSGNQLWVGYGCGTDWAGGVVGLDVSASAPQPTELVAERYGAPRVAAAGDTLVVGDTGLSPADLLVYDVGATPAVLRGEIDGHTHDLYNLLDLAITPDGSMVISAFGSPYRYEGWNTTSLAKIRTYGEEETHTGYPAAVAISADGAHVAAGWTREPSRSIELYDAATAAKVYTKSSPTGEMVEGSLTFSGTHIVGVLRESFTDRLHLWRSEGAALPTSTVTLTGPSAATVQEPLTLTGRLALTDGSAPGAQPLVVTRRLPDGTSATLADVTTAADGAFTITDTPQVAGETSYDVRWEGDRGYQGSTASVTVAVAKQQSSLTLTGPTEGVIGEQLRFSGELSFDGQAPGSPLSLKVLRTVLINHRPVTAQLTVTTSNDGSFNFSDRLTMSGRYKYTVQWAGNNVIQSAEATHNVTV
ncbi:hypothetical protein ABZV14_06985 [Streptosporangium canum]|uniref:hypothetical protein n=1 Tax=Streptosporangium canum TaxID=324952 RepID=UPI0033AD200C